jgi:hypothetical protein
MIQHQFQHQLLKQVPTALDSDNSSTLYMSLYMSLSSRHCEVETLPTMCLMLHPGSLMKH